MKITPKMLLNARYSWAYTLIEVMIVVIIVGVIAGLGIMQFSRMVELQRCRTAKQNLVTIWGALEIYKTRNGSYPMFMYPTSQINTTLGLNIYDSDFLYGLVGNGSAYYLTATRGGTTPIYQILMEQIPIEGTNPGCLTGSCPDGCF